MMVLGRGGGAGCPLRWSGLLDPLLQANHCLFLHADRCRLILSVDNDCLDILDKSNELTYLMRSRLHFPFLTSIVSIQYLLLEHPCRPGEIDNIWNSLARPGPPLGVGFHRSSILSKERNFAATLFQPESSYSRLLNTCTNPR